MARASDTPTHPLAAGDPGRAAAGRPAAPARRRDATAWRTTVLAALATTMVATVLVSAVMLSLRNERNLRQEAVTRAAEHAVAAVRAHLSASEIRLGFLAASLGSDQGAPLESGVLHSRFLGDARAMLAEEPALLRIEHRAENGRLLDAVSAPPPRPRLDNAERQQPGFEATVALRSAVQFDRPLYSRPYYVSYGELQGFEVTELAIPVDSIPPQVLVAVFSMPLLLDGALPAEVLASHQIMLSESDGTFVARSSSRLRGAGVYQAAIPLELPGVSLRLRVNSIQGLPRLIPNLLTAMLVAMTLGLAASGGLLWRDTQRRLRAERELHDQHAFRKAMEDSLFTGLRARNMDGEVTYVNPAFCRMTGFEAHELIGRSPPMPYWTNEPPPDDRPRLDRLRGSEAMRLGYETEFVRRNGERFPVLIFEAPLIDEHGTQTGWMGSILDLTEQRRAEALNRVQQEKLQANARLALLGEVATSLSHELNQPLAAIASYASASENLLDPDRHRPSPGSSGNPPVPVQALRTALARIRGQSERAGQVIRSVHDFVRRRHVDRAVLPLDVLVGSIEPLIRLQARRAGCGFRWRAGPGMAVNGDQTMLEQVLLNLTRNAFDAMENASPRERIVELDATLTGPPPVVRIEICDRGPGVAPEIAAQLFQPFVTDKADGLGIGLSLCRSVIEAHGGSLRYLPRPGGGSIFRIELPGVPSDRSPPPES